MNGERTADDVSRRLARASGRRAVLAGLVASLAAGVAGASGGPVAERASHRDCRDRRGCGFGERCVRGRCKRRTGFAGRNQACEIDADCTQVDAPTVCVMAPPCVCGDGGPKDGPAPCQPFSQCRGRSSASCADLCECADGLVCRGGQCAASAGG